MSEPIYITLDEPFYVNQSRVRSYQSCDRLYGWQYVEGLVPDRPKKQLELGSAVHKAMEIMHSGDGSEENFQLARNAAEARFRSTMSRIILPGDEADLQEGLATLDRLLPAYRAHYAAKGQLWKPLGMEVSFCVEVGEGTNVWLVGRIDNLVTYANGLWLVDYKTMDKLDFRNFTKFEMDLQLTAYIYGGTKQLSLDSMARGEPPTIVRGAIIDGLVKTQVPQFHRELYRRTIEDLREFEVEFVEKAREIAIKHMRVENGEPWKAVFPKNTNQCFAYGTCAFRDLCMKDNDTRRLGYVQRSADYVDTARQKSRGDTDAKV